MRLTSKRKREDRQNEKQTSQRESANNQTVKRVPTTNETPKKKIHDRETGDPDEKTTEY